MRRQPIQVLLATVPLLLAKPVFILLAQIRPEHTQPHIMVQALASPNRGRVVLVLNRTITTLLCVLSVGRSQKVRAFWAGQEPMRRIQELGRLQNHLYDMLVTVPARTTRRLVRQIKDIHSSCG